jgi:hypothetical protein
VLSGPALAALEKSDTAFDDLGVATAAAGHQLGAVMAPAITLAVNAMAAGLGVTANFFGTIAGGKDAIENIIPLMKAMEKMGFSMAGFKPAELAKALEEQKAFGAEAKRLHEELVAKQLADDKKLTASAEKQFLESVALAVKLNQEFGERVLLEEHLNALQQDFHKPPSEDTEFMKRIREREEAIRNLQNLMPELDRNEAEQSWLHNLKAGNDALREGQELYKKRFEALDNELTVDQALAEQQAVMFQMDSSFSEKTEVARRVATQAQISGENRATANLQEQYDNRLISFDTYQAQLTALQIRGEADRTKIVMQFPTFFERQMQSLVNSNAFAIAQITTTWSSGLATSIVDNTDFVEQAWRSTQIALIQGAINTTIQLAAEWALRASVEMGILTATEAAKLGLKESSNAVLVASDAAAATATTGIWAGAMATMAGFFAAFTGAITSMMAGLMATITAVGEFVMGILSAIASALGLSPFTVGFAAAILAGVAIIAAALLASKTIEFAEGGIVTGPTLGLVGEAGPEAIIPLDRMGDFGGGNDRPIIVKTYLDGRQIARAQTRHTAASWRWEGAPG